MNQELLAQLIELLGRPESEVMDELDEFSRKHPNLASKIATLKAFLQNLYLSLPDRTMEAVSEAMSLFKTGSGPVDPNIGDTA